MLIHGNGVAAYTFTFSPRNDSYLLQNHRARTLGPRSGQSHIPRA